MRSALALALVAAVAVPALAQEQPPAQPAAPARPKAVEPRKFENGKLVDSYWGVTYELAGLAEQRGVRQGGKLFDGRCGAVAVEVSIFEHPDELSAKERRDAKLKGWQDRRRQMADLQQGDEPAPWVLFTEESLSGAKRQHGYSYHVRGPRTFEVHASVSEKAQGTSESIQAALRALAVGPETGASVWAEVIGRRSERGPDDPSVLLEAAGQYMQQDDPYNPQKPAIAEGLLTHATKKLAGSTLERDPAQMFDLHHNLGLAILTQRKAVESIPWFQKAVELAAKTNEPGPKGALANYNLACACSVAGKLDEAFAALEKSFERFPVVTVDHLRTDTDLENVRKDARWAPFLAARGGK